MGKKGSKRTKKFLASGGLKSKVTERRKRQKVQRLRSEQKITRKERSLARKPRQQPELPGPQRPEGTAEDGEGADQAFAAMPLDDFLTSGFLEGEASDAESNEDEQIPASNEAQDDTADATEDVTEDTGDETATHKKELAELKKSDPEFYKFLSKSGGDLLQFGDDDEEEEAVIDNLVAGDEADTVVENQSDEEDDDSDDDSRKIVLTPTLFKAMKVAVFEKKSLGGLRKHIQAFRSACHLGQDQDGDDSRKARAFVFRIKNSDVFNDLMISSVEQMAGIFSHHLKWRSTASQSLPSSSAKWERLRPAVSSFCGNLMHFLSQLMDEEMKLFILQSLQPYIPFLAALPKLHRRLIKVLLKAWGAANEASVAVRLAAFLRLRQLAILAPVGSHVVDNCLKGIYLTHIRNSKFVNEASAPGVAMRRNCVVEMFMQRPQASYQHVFVYIRQLAISLRLALAKPSQESVRTVYNWQFLESLRTWTQLLCTATTTSPTAASVLQPLVYPLVQIIRGTATLQPTASYVPMRLHCFVLINDLSAATDVYVPAVPMLLALLGSAPLRQRTKGRRKTKMIKPPLLDLVLRFQKASLDAGVVQDQVVLRTLALLTDYFQIHRYSIAFPELLFPAGVQLRQFMKTCKNPLWRQAVRQLLTDSKKWSEVVKNQRADVDFGPGDTAQVARFMASQKNAARQQRLKKPLLAQWQVDLENTPGVPQIGPRPASNKDSKTAGKKAVKKTGKEQEKEELESEKEEKGKETKLSRGKRRRAKKAEAAAAAAAAARALDDGAEDAPDEVGNLQMSSDDDEGEDDLEHDNDDDSE